MKRMTTEEKLQIASVLHNDKQRKTQAQKNSEVLVDILDVLEKLTDRMNDIELNVRYLHNVVKDRENKLDGSNNGWFIF